MTDMRFSPYKYGDPLRLNLDNWNVFNVFALMDNLHMIDSAILNRWWRALTYIADSKEDWRTALYVTVDRKEKVDIPTLTYKRFKTIIVLNYKVHFRGVSYACITAMQRAIVRLAEYDFSVSPMENWDRREKTEKMIQPVEGSK